jgi:hypothetical protein
MRVISSASYIRHWSQRFLFLKFCSDRSLSARSYKLLSARSLKYCWCTESDTIYFSHIITCLILTQGSPNVIALSS